MRTGTGRGMADQTSALTVVSGGRAQPVKQFALSLIVHERKRLDIPLDTIIGINAFATQSFVDGRNVMTYNLPHIAIRVTPSMQRRLREFTAGIAGELMEIHVGGRCVSQPRLQEPLGNQPAFQISIYDFADAQALAETLCTGWRPVKVVE
jgi:preprotein translocase subunit SecD